MASHVSFNHKIEQEAWECFEVGAYDDVLELQKSNPENPFLQHLTAIVLFENQQFKEMNQLKLSGSSILDFLVKSYLSYSNNRPKDALKFFIQYIQSPGYLFHLTIFQFGVKLAFELEEYKACLYIMDLDRGGLNEKYYYNEKISSLFALKKYTEIIQYFKKIHSFINVEQGVYIKTALSLQALGKYKESELLLKKVPNIMKLPSFEEKRDEILETIKNISNLETKDNLSNEELKELGFAYLFNSQYDKAEELFKKATVSFAAG